MVALTPIFDENFLESEKYPQLWKRWRVFSAFVSFFVWDMHCNKSITNHGHLLTSKCCVAYRTMKSYALVADMVYDVRLGISWYAFGIWKFNFSHCELRPCVMLDLNWFDMLNDIWIILRVIWAVVDCHTEVKDAWYDMFISLLDFWVRINPMNNLLSRRHGPDRDILSVTVR